jgi:hypothetical protein
MSPDDALGYTLGLASTPSVNSKSNSFERGWTQKRAD